MLGMREWLFILLSLWVLLLMDLIIMKGLVLRLNWLMILVFGIWIFKLSIYINAQVAQLNIILGLDFLHAYIQIFKRTLINLRFYVGTIQLIIREQKFRR